MKRQLGEALFEQECEKLINKGLVRVRDPAKKKEIKDQITRFGIPSLSSLCKEMHSQSVTAS